ncbi:uncharacterized protein LOC131255376 [Magnolia sinica]|uniref:uncharacterized protein LOC131255376 n=1 Tax=Magnolia sinica TaxID=86752 RepID=UPI002659FFFE|nr:uncharacterized protein LOC131255376 [Magnolia sinica]
MATPNFRFLFFSFLLFSLLFCDFSKAERWRSHYHIAKVSSLIPAAALVCSPSKAPNPWALTLAHQHGPCSPLGGNKQAATPDQILLQDQSRVSWIRSRISSSSQQLQPQASLAENTLPARSGSSLSTGNYVVTVGFGTPKRDMTLVFDTGSDLTWIQCEPCAGSCYSQQEKIFNPSQSSSYLNVSCNSGECALLRPATGNPTGCSSSTCLYAIRYGDQSYSIGFFSHETLTVGTDVFPNFQFGCGQKNQGLFGSTAGLLGLGRNKISFTSQTAKKFGQVFSYCLPSSPKSTGYLKLGASTASSGVKYTPLLTDQSSPSFYFLDLIAITVGGRRLPIPASVFSTAGTLIDSGTVITRLPPSAYSALRSAFRTAMSKYPSAPALSILDTCFDLSSYNSISVPKIALQFREGAEVNVDLSGILLGSSTSQICLAFAGNSDDGDVAIFGNKQQQTFGVVYDVARGRIGFGAGGCSWHKEGRLECISAVYAAENSPTFRSRFFRSRAPVVVVVLPDPDLDFPDPATSVAIAIPPDPDTATRGRGRGGHGYGRGRALSATTATISSEPSVSDSTSSVEGLSSPLTPAMFQVLFIFLGMATPNFRFLFFSFLLFYLLFCDCSKADKWRSHYHIAKVSSLIPAVALACSPSKAPNPWALTLAHQHGPCSPFGGNKQAATPDQILPQDQSRVSWIRSRISSASQQLQPQASLAENTLPARSGRSLGTGNYVVTVGFGTPKRDMTLFFDTGSDLTWIQCEPCAGSCYSQQEKIFDPSQSSSYLNVSCKSRECTLLRPATGYPSRCSSSTCLYTIDYVDQSYSIGFFSHETLTVGTDVFPNFQFGCGQMNQDLYARTAGLLGLGRNKISFTSQTAKKYGQVFSYCLPSSPSSTGYLKFGASTASASSGVKYTPLLTDQSSPSFYFLDLIAITVGGRRLPIPASVFSTAGTVIDSGTVITRLPPSAYSALRSAFRTAMSKYPSAPALSILDTCFNFSGYNSISVPKIALQFRGGAKVNVDFSGILFRSSTSQICLAFTGNSNDGDVAIFGNKQQQTFGVVYDVARGRIGFGAGGCS